MLHRHATLLCTALLATDALAEPQGLVEDSQLELRNRNFYFNRDFRNGASNSQGDNAARPASERKGYREEWAHGVMLGLTSGYTWGSMPMHSSASNSTAVRGAPVPCCCRSAITASATPR